MSASSKKLSNELMALVFSYLSKSDLQNVRQVCRRFEVAGTPHLFDHIHLSFDPLDLDSADAIINTFGRYITTMTVTAVYYEEVSLDQPALDSRGSKAIVGKYRKRINKIMHLPKLDEKDIAFLVHRHQALRTAQQEVIHAQRLRTCIAKAYTTLPKLTAIQLYGEWPETRGMSTRQSKYLVTSLKTLQLDGNKTNLPVDTSDPVYQLGTINGFFVDELRPWHDVLVGLLSTKKSITKLQAWHSSAGTELSTVLSDYFPRPQLSTPLHSLTVLQLSVNQHTFFFESQSDYSPPSFSLDQGDSPLVKLLQTLTHLKSLTLVAYKMPPWDEGKTKIPLRPLTLPNLLHLKLENIYCTGKDLTTLLSHSPHLAHIDLSYIHLIIRPPSVGTWATVFDSIKATQTALKTIRISEIDGRFTDGIQLWNWYWENPDQVNEFFFQGGGGINPFSRQGMEAHLASLRAAQDRLVGRQPGLEERAERLAAALDRAR